MGRLKGSKTGQYTLVHFTCERCGKPFSRRPSAAVHARFCSNDCYRPKRDLLTCETCGKQFAYHASTRGRFCSMACVRSRVTKTCPWCKRDFEVKTSKAEKFTYCSLGCRRAACEASLITILCARCMKAFQVRPAQSAAVYCSKECMRGAQYAMLTCEYCGREKRVERTRITHGIRFCSNHCATRHKLETTDAHLFVGRKRQLARRTDIERMTERVLASLGVPYIFEHKVGRYSVDFALPSLGIALECDGWHHRTPRGIAHDAERDVYLAERQWRPVHLDERDIRADCVTAVARGLGLVA